MRINNLPPPHKSEKVFRRYEAHIITILYNWPNTSEFVNTGVAVTTFSARLRDAINSVLEYNWPSKDGLDIDLLRRIWVTENQLEIVPVPDETLVVARCKKRVLPQGVSAESKAIITNTSESAFGIIVNNPARHIVHAIAILHSEGLITQLTKIINLNPQIAEELKVYGDKLAVVNDGEEITILS